MQAIIVAGGRGERLRPLTDTTPKPMLNIGGKPLLEHIILQFKKAQITDIIIALCYLPDVVTAYFGNGNNHGVHIRYTYEEPGHPLGTAGAIGLARNMITGNFFVTYADILRDVDFADMAQFHQKHHAFATIQTYLRTGTNPKSEIVTDTTARITAFTERPRYPAGNVVNVRSNGSLYLLSKQIFRSIASGTLVDFGKDIFPDLIKNNKLYSYDYHGIFIDVGTREKLIQAEEYLSNHL